jgi:uncharacterized protein (TIGR02145 family)
VVTPNLGTGITYTNAEGVFTGRVPKNQLLTLNILLTCESTNDWNLVYSEDFSSATEPIVGQYEPASLEGRFPITGTVTNCVGQPVESGYVKMGPQIFLTENGNFTIQTCQFGEYSIRGFNSNNPDSIKVSEMVTLLVESNTTDAGDLIACSLMFGSVIDIEGNSYETVLIGDQWWMAENLKSAHFSDGSEIINVSDYFSWMELNTAAWSNYENLSSNDVLYGKLYNWFSVIDSRNICPTGWHVPTDNEWDLLIGFLDPSFVPLTEGIQSVSAGGKMKSISSWMNPNAFATNESGFSGLPGGRSGNFGEGFFVQINSDGFWWSSSEVDEYFVWNRYLHYSSGIIGRGSFTKQYGFSVRCVKD